MEIGTPMREVIVEPLQMPEPLRQDAPREPDLSPDYLPAVPEPVYEPVEVPVAV